MTDREMLELAAKAAGIRGEWSERGQCIVISELGISWEHWRPLEDDGDALRLAVKLNLHIQFDIDEFGTVFIFGPWYGEPIEQEATGDKFAAARRAITRAAAEIGRKML